MVAWCELRASGALCAPAGRAGYATCVAAGRTRSSARQALDGGGAPKIAFYYIRARRAAAAGGLRGPRRRTNDNRWTAVVCMPPCLLWPEQKCVKRSRVSRERSNAAAATMK